MRSRRVPTPAVLVAWAALMALALLLAGCSGGSSRSASASAAAAAGAKDAADQASASAYVLPGCPTLRHQPVVDGGLPDLTLPCLGDGPGVRLADLRGTPTVLEVWAAWCTICRDEMPKRAKAVAKAGDRVRFLGIHYKATRGQGQQAAAEFGVPFPSVQDTDGDKTVLALQAKAPPLTVFVSADGRIVFRKFGGITTAEFEDLVSRYLGVTL